LQFGTERFSVQDMLCGECRRPGKQCQSRGDWDRFPDYRRHLFSPSDFMSERNIGLHNQSIKQMILVISIGMTD
jgi:hypothetical protein